MAWKALPEDQRKSRKAEKAKPLPLKKLLVAH
jgi:hypothetical protein